MAKTATHKKRKTVPIDVTRLEAMAEEATVDAYGESEQICGWVCMLEEHVAVPFFRCRPPLRPAPSGSRRIDTGGEVGSRWSMIDGVRKRFLVLSSWPLAILRPWASQPRA